MGDSHAIVLTCDLRTILSASAKKGGLGTVTSRSCCSVYYLRHEKRLLSLFRCIGRESISCILYWLYATYNGIGIGILVSLRYNERMYLV